MSKQGERTTALIVEDEADIRTFAARVLELEGYCVLQAADGVEGLRLANEHRPSIILLDMRLPGLSGSELLESLKANPQLTASTTIVFSASADPALIESALRKGAAAYLVKPVSAVRLREFVASTLGSKA